MEIDMPPGGWGLKVQEATCPFCGPIRSRSFYIHPELEEKMGMSQAEFTKYLHLSDNHRYHRKTDTWTAGSPYRWYVNHWPWLGLLASGVRWTRWGIYRTWRKVRHG